MLNQTRVQYWMKHNLFTPTWWLLLLLTIAAYYVWWKLVDKKRIFQIASLGFLTVIVTTLLDTCGTEIPRLWFYRVQLLPLVHLMIIVDYAFIPVCFMLMYQYFVTWKAYLIASVGMAILLSFVAEPVAIMTGFYQPEAWRHIYSFPIYYIMAVTIRWVIEKLVFMQRRAGSPNA